jgi:hypothetical protein
MTSFNAPAFAGALSFPAIGDTAPVRLTAPVAAYAATPRRPLVTV